MTVSVVNAWSGSLAQPSAFGTTPPALQGVPVALTPANSVGSGSGTPTAGNWLVCVTGMNEPSAAAGFTAGVADDVHSFWRPGDVTKSNWAVSTASALTRTSIWYTANTVRAPGYVYVSPNGCLDAYGTLILEISGLGPWDVITGIFTNYAAAATSLNLALPSPSSQALLIAAVTGDSTSAGQAFAPSGWTALPGVSVSNGTDHTCDCVLTSAYLLTTGSVSVNGTASSAADLSGVVIGFQVSAPSPVSSGSDGGRWPGRMVAEAAFGGGYESPPDTLTWTPLMDSAWPGTWQGSSTQFKRAWGWTDSTSIPWALGQYQSSSGSITLDNFDGWLTPSNTGSGYYFAPVPLNANPSFQASVRSWTAQNGATLAQSPAQVFASAPSGLPQFSAMITPNGTTALPGIISERDAVSASSPYSASAWFYTAAAYAAGAEVAVSWYTSGGTFISASTASAVALPAGTWTQVTLADQTSPGTAAFAAVTVQLAGTPAGSQVFWAAEAALAAGPAIVTTGNVDAGTPVRLRMALGTVTTVNPPATTVYDRWYVWQRNAQSWPEARNKIQRNFVAATTTDVWQSASGPCPSPYRGEIYQDTGTVKCWWWPCDDQPLTGGVLPTTLRNAAPGNTQVLTVEASPNGVSPQDTYSSGITGSGGTDLTTTMLGFAPGGTSVGAPPAGVATQTVGQASGWMYGDPPSAASAQATAGGPVSASPGSNAWQVTGTLGNSGAHSWFLACNDTTFPPLSAGAAVEGWFNYGLAGSGTDWFTSGGLFSNAGSQPFCPLTLLELATSSAPVCALQLSTGGHLSMLTGSTLGTSTSIYSGSDLRNGSWFHVVLNLTSAGWAVYVNGGLTALVTGSATLTSAWTWLLVNGDLGSSGGSALTSVQHGGNMSVSHLAVYPFQLPAWRITARYAAAATGFGALPAPSGLALSAIGAHRPASTATGSISSVPDGTEFQGSYASGASSFGISAVAASVAGSYTSGPSARATTGGTGGEVDSSAYGDAVWASWTALAPLVQVFTAANAGSETEAAACLGSGDSFTSGYGSGASGHGVCQVSAGTGASPPTAASALGDTVQQRLERILGLGGITYPGRAIDPAALQVQAALDIGGQSAGGNVSGIVASDGGWWFADLCGVLNYRSKAHLNADTAVWQIGMNVSAGQIPFAGDITYDNDPTRVYAVIAVQPYSPDGATLAEATPAGYAAVLAAQRQYGPRPLNITSYLQSASEMATQANWLFAYYGTIRRRIKQLTIDAASFPAAWGLVLGLSLADLISVTDQPFGAPAMTTVYRVSSANRALSFGANDMGTQGKIVLAADPVVAFWS